MRRRVIVSGLLHDGLGLGEAARGYGLALATAGYEVAQHLVQVPGRPFPLGDPGLAGLLPCPIVDADAEADLVLLCLNPPELASLRAESVPLPAGRATVGGWAWELDPVPTSWAAGAERLDELWVHSRHVQQLLEPVVDIPVLALPPALGPLKPGETWPLAEVERPTFLALGDVTSSLARKNPAGAIQAFVRAFRPDEGPQLLVKVWNGLTDPVGMEGLRELASGRSDVVVLDRWLPRSEFVSLLAASDCLVSMHRAEGLGLPIFEALALGVPVVATGCSGPMDLLDESIAYLVRSEPASVPEGVLGYPAGSRWAEPDIDHAAQQLRAVWEDLPGARRRAERGRDLVARELSPLTVGTRLRDRVEELVTRARPSSSPRSPLRPPVSVVTHAAEPWPELAEFLERTVTEVRSVEGELVVGASDDRVLPEQHRPPGVRVVVTGSRSPFSCRASALAEADGDLLIMTEDHCRPDPGWCRAHLEAYRKTGAALLAGTIRNGSAATPVDWANYLIDFSFFAPELTVLSVHRCPTPANCAVPRDVLRAKAGGPPRPAWFERVLVHELWREGMAVPVPEASVHHTQPFPWWRHIRGHFDDARCAGFEASSNDPACVPRIHPRDLKVFAEHFLRQTSGAVASRPSLHEHHRRAAWWLRALALTKAVGLAVGGRFGQGRSAERLD